MNICINCVHHSYGSKRTYPFYYCQHWCATEERSPINGESKYVLCEEFNSDGKCSRYCETPKKKTLIKRIIELIKKKFFCCHEWEQLYSCANYTDYSHGMPSSHTKILTCKKCGKIKKIEY